MTLIVKDLKKKFNRHEVLKGVSFSIEKGEIVTIQGKSGEGKTTILRCINGLERADSGSIEISGEYLCKSQNGTTTYARGRELDYIRTKIGLVFQDYNLFPHMTVRENMVLAPFWRDLYSEEAMEERVDKLLLELDLLNKKDSYPGELSGGQQQRVAIARACMLEPDILCFDEPTAALDEQTRDQIQLILEDLSRKGMAIIIVTHDREFSYNISNRVLHISEGKLKEEIIKERRVD